MAYKENTVEMLKSAFSSNVMSFALAENTTIKKGSAVFWVAGKATNALTEGGLFIGIAEQTVSTIYGPYYSTKILVNTKGVYAFYYTDITSDNIGDAAYIDNEVDNLHIKTYDNLDTSLALLKIGVIMSVTDEVAYVRIDGYTFEQYIEILGIRVTGITLNKKTSTKVVGATDQLTAVVAPTDASNKAIRWESTNTDVATVSSSGLVTAVAAGTTNIVATTEDGYYEATCVYTITAE